MDNLAFLLFAPVLLMSIVIHEVAHAWQARREGDDTAERLGRITLNPIRHMDPIGSVLVPLGLWFMNAPFFFGWAKPVPVNPANFRHLKAGDIRVSLAGIVSNLILATLCMLVMAGLVSFQGGRGTELLRQVVYLGLRINLVLAVFNLLPIPPLDGSHVLYRLLPPRAAELYLRAGRWGFIVILALVFFLPNVLSLLMAPVDLLEGAATWFIRLWI